MIANKQILPNITETAAASAASVGVVTSVDVNHLTTYDRSCNSFAASFLDDLATASSRLTDWFIGIKHHSPLIFRRTSRGTALKKKLMRLLKSNKPRHIKAAFEISKLLARGAQDFRPWDMAEAMWYQSASLITDHSHQILFTNPNVQNEISRVLLANGILVDANIGVKLPGTNRPLRFCRPFYSVRTYDVRPVGFGNHNSTYVYESPLAFMPTVIRCYPYSSDHASAKLVMGDLRTLQKYTDSRIATPKIIASGAHFIVRERIFGPRPSHLEDPFYGLSKESVCDAKNSLEQLRDNLTLFGFVHNAEVSRFLEGHAVLNLVTGGWAIARPLVQGYSANNYKRLSF